MFSLTGSPFGLKNASNLRPLNLLQVIYILGHNTNDNFLIFFRYLLSVAYCIAPNRSLQPVDQMNHLLQILITLFTTKQLVLSNNLKMLTFEFKRLILKYKLLLSGFA